MRHLRSLLTIYLLSLAAVSAQAQQTYSPKVIDLAFAQGNTGNCPSVALTKWVISTYGTHPSKGILAVAPNDDKSESVTLADGTVVTVTPEQEIIAATHSKFDPRYTDTDPALPSIAIRKDVLDAANRLYAVLAILELGEKNGRTNDGRRLSLQDFEKGFHYLDDGGEVDNFIEDLGFKIVDVTVFTTAVPNIFGSTTHVVFVMNENDGGNYNQNIYDEHGRLKSIAESYDYKLGRKGHRWRYALDTETTNNPTLRVVRQCERSAGHWDSCSDFNY